MELGDLPDKLVVPFADSGGKNAIPVTSATPGAASLEDGFPPLTRTPILAGGIPPAGLDMNGILYLLSAIDRWMNAGGGFPYDSVFATDPDVNGYPQGARVLRSDGTGYWLNTVDNNTSDPEDTGAAAAGWVPDFTTGIASITMTNTNVTLTQLQYGKPIIAISGLLSANLNLILPNIAGNWIVLNNTTGAYSITAKTLAGTGVVLGVVTPIVGDSVNIYPISTDASLMTYTPPGTGAISTTVSDQFDLALSFSNYCVGDGVTNDSVGIINCITEAAASDISRIFLDGKFYFASAGVLDFSAISNIEFIGPGGFIGPAVGFQGSPTLGIKLWGTLGSPVAFGSTIAPGTRSFTATNTFAQNDSLLLSNFPTDATDAFTSGSTNIFGLTSRQYANVSSSNLRQTRRKEILNVNGTGGTFTVYSSTVYNYASTQSLQFQKINAVQNVTFTDVTFINIITDAYLCESLKFQNCLSKSSAFTTRSCSKVKMDFIDFNAQNADCRLDFYDSSNNITVTGNYRNANSASDNGVIKFNQCTNFKTDVIVNGCANNGVMVDTNFGENPLGYTDVDVSNFNINTVAQGCIGQGISLTCDPFAAQITYGNLKLAANDCGLAMKGVDNIVADVAINHEDGSNNSVILYGNSNCTIRGVALGGLYKSTITNPRGSPTPVPNTAINYQVNYSTLLQTGFSAFKSSNSTNATGNGATVLIIFDNVNIYNGGYYDNTTGIFTADSDGLFDFSSAVELANLSGSNTGSSLSLLTTSANYVVNTGNVGALMDTTNQVSITASWKAIKMSAGDTAQIRAIVSGSTQTVTIVGSGTSVTYFHGAKVS